MGSQRHTVHLIISRMSSPGPQVPSSPLGRESTQDYQRGYPDQDPRMRQMNDYQQQMRLRHQQYQQQQQQNQLAQPQHDQLGGQFQPAPRDDGVDLGLLFKLLVLVFILAQGGSTTRALFLLGGAFVVYLYLTGRFRIQLNHRYNPRPRAPRPQQQPRGENADGQPQDNADVQQEVEEDNRGIMGEVSDIVIPFISSLSPTWNPYDFDQQQPGGEHAPPVPPANEPANEPAA